MEITKIATHKIYEKVAEQIKRQIVEGKLQPGEKLPSTREFSERFQVGRSTIREALSALKAMGLVESRQGEGSYVRSNMPEQVSMPDFESMQLSRETVLELLEARKSLEVSNAAIAAEKRTEEDLETFEGILATMQENLGNEAEGEKADMLFHLTLARATHNTIMVRLLETISGQMESAIRGTRRLQMYSNRSVSAQLWREHQNIYAAIRAGDPIAAQDAMREHLFHVERVLIPYVK